MLRCPAQFTSNIISTEKQPETVWLTRAKVTLLSIARSNPPFNIPYFSISQVTRPQEKKKHKRDPTTALHTKRYGRKFA